MITPGEKKLHIYVANHKYNETITQTNTSDNSNIDNKCNANGVWYSVIRERGGDGSERANTKTRKTIK